MTKSSSLPENLRLSNFVGTLTAMTITYTLQTLQTLQTLRYQTFFPNFQNFHTEKLDNHLPFISSWLLIYFRCSISANQAALNLIHCCLIN